MSGRLGELLQGNRFAIGQRMVRTDNQRQFIVRHAKGFQVRRFRFHPREADVRFTLRHGSNGAFAFGHLQFRADTGELTLEFGQNLRQQGCRRHRARGDVQHPGDRARMPPHVFLGSGDQA
jgi:hypothetical protein